MIENTWNAALYDARHSFVTVAGEALIDLLDPQPGERVADLPEARSLLCLRDDGERCELVAVVRALGCADASDPHPLVPRSCLAWWGWALTCHKAQGSEWPTVLAFDRAFGSAEDRRRWRYTAATRASRRLHWLA